MVFSVEIREIETCSDTNWQQNGTRTLGILLFTTAVRRMAYVGLGGMTCVT